MHSIIIIFKFRYYAREVTADRIIVWKLNTEGNYFLRENYKYHRIYDFDLADLGKVRKEKGQDVHAVLRTVGGS